MKIVKYIISIAVLFLCITLSGELFQSHLQTFSNRYYFVDIEAEDREAVVRTLVDVAKQNGENVFAVERTVIDAFHSQIAIYAAPDFQKYLTTEADIAVGGARSLFSGTTDVFFCPFENVIENQSVNRYYFTGSKDTVGTIRKHINGSIHTSHIHKESVTGNENLIYAVWILSLAFIMMLTWMDIQFNRKSDFLKISMGSSIYRIVCKNIFLDLLFYLSAACILFVSMSTVVFVSYRIVFVICVLAAFIILNSLLYVTIFKANYKEIIYGANVNGKLLANTYLLKAMVVILMVVSLSCNLTIIRKNIDGLKPYEIIEKLDGYNTISVVPVSDVMGDEQRFNEFNTRFFVEAYLNGKIFLSTSCAALDEPIIVLNNDAVDKVVSTPSQFHDNDTDFVVYIPESKTETVDDYDIEFAVTTTASNLFGIEKYDYEVKIYESSEVVYFDLRAESELPFGFDMISDPVIVLCNLENTQENISQLENAYIEFGDRWSNIIYNLNDLSIFSTEIKGQIDSVDYISVLDQCARHRLGLIRTLAMNTILSAFLVVLSVLLISVIVKMEYLINSKEIALKRILGYSLIKRNLTIILLNIFAVFIAFVTGIFLSNMYELFDLFTLCIVCLFVFLMDTMLILSNMAVAERKNTANILKGGSL